MTEFRLHWQNIRHTPMTNLEVAEIAVDVNTCPACPKVTSYLQMLI